MSKHIIYVGLSSALECYLGDSTEECKGELDVCEVGILKISYFWGHMDLFLQGGFLY